MINPPYLQNNTTNVVIQQNSREPLMMDILMSETCWAHKKWNKIASDIKLVFYSSTLTMMHGPINISCNYSAENSTYILIQIVSVYLCYMLRPVLRPTSYVICCANISRANYVRVFFFYYIILTKTTSWPTICKQDSKKKTL